MVLAIKIITTPLWQNHTGNYKYFTLFIPQTPSLSKTQRELLTYEILLLSLWSHHQSLFPKSYWLWFSLDFKRKFSLCLYCWNHCSTRAYGTQSYQSSKVNFKCAYIMEFICHAAQIMEHRDIIICLYIIDINRKSLIKWANWTCMVVLLSLII